MCCVLDDYSWEGVSERVIMLTQIQFATNLTELGCGAKGGSANFLKDRRTSKWPPTDR